MFLFEWMKSEGQIFTQKETSFKERDLKKKMFPRKLKLWLHLGQFYNLKIQFTWDKDTHTKNTDTNECKHYTEIAFFKEYICQALSVWTGTHNCLFIDLWIRISFVNETTRAIQNVILEGIKGSIRVLGLKWVSMVEYYACVQESEKWRLLKKKKLLLQRLRKKQGRGWKIVVCIELSILPARSIALFSSTVSLG